MISKENNESKAQLKIKELLIQKGLNNEEVSQAILKLYGISNIIFDLWLTSIEKEEI